MSDDNDGEAVCNANAKDPATKPTKASKRANSPSSHRKTCDLCHTPKDVLVRCRIDDTLQWRLVCTSKCWQQVSGGEIDGPGKEWYQYGGMWKNRHALVSAKKPKHKANKAVRAWEEEGVRYIVNDKVTHQQREWVCRRTHQSSETTAPGLGYTFWKEEASRTPPRRDDQESHESIGSS